MQFSKKIFTKLYITTTVIMLLTSSLCLYGLMFAPVEADAGWLSGWQYRKSHVIQSAAGAGTDYTTKVNVVFNETQNYYYSLSSSWTTVSGNPTSMHYFEPAHKTGIVEVDKTVDGATRKYLAYDSSPDGSGIRLYYTDDLDGVWTPYSLNPILGPNIAHYYLCSVAYDGSTFHMFLDDNTDNVMERWTSTDGITFTQQETLSATNTQYMSMFIWFNPNDNKWYLYHKQHGTPRILWARNSTDITSLGSAKDIKVMDDTDATPGTVSGATIMYRDGKYWMVTEGQVGSVWNVWAYSSSSPTSGFKICSNSPILTNGEACPIHMLSPDGSKAYLFVSRQSGTNWYEETREIYSTFQAPSSYAPYYNLSPSSTSVSGNPTTMHFLQPAHKTGIVEVDKLVDGATRKYLAYDCDPDGNTIRLYYTDDLDGVWAPYSLNPILGPSSGHYRTPSVAYDGSTFHMFLDDIADYHVERWTSTDGITFTQQETIPIVTETIYMCPYIWFNPNDNKWYLYHKQHGTPRILWARNSTDITSLGSATDIRVMDDTDAAPGTVAAQCIMYRDGKYWMVTEGQVGSVWNVWAYSSSSPTSGFKICSNSPILTNGEACPIHMLSPDGSKAYLFVSRQSGTNWYEETREIYSTFPNPPSTPSDTTNCKGHCKPDFGDIRFTGSDGTTLLNYWMQEKVDGDHAIFWVKVADDLSSSNATIYMYYGNSSATTTSNGNGAFSFFDDFPGSSLNSSKWIVRQGDVSVAGSELKLTGTTGTRGLIDGLTSFSINKALYAKARWGSSSIGNNHFCSMRKSNDFSYRGGDAYGSGSTFDYETDNVGTATQTKGISLTTPTNYHVYEITWKSGQSTIYQDGTQKAQHTTNVPTTDQVVVFYEGTSGDVYVDWCFVRKWVDPEPSHGVWGGEESPAAKLFTDPSLIQKNPSTVNSTFDVSINISNVNDLFAFDVNITWDNTLITYDSIDKTPLDAIWPQGHSEVYDPPLTGPGWLKFVSVANGGSGYTGAHSLFKVTFKIVKACNFPAQTAIHFVTAKLSNSLAQSITVTTTDGQYQMNAKPPDLELELVNPNPLKPFECCKTFNIEVYATDIGSSLKDYDFRILFTSEFLNLTGVNWTGGKLGGAEDNAVYQIISAGSVHVWDTGGTVWNGGVDGKGLLFTLVFHIEFDDSTEHIWRVDHHTNLTGEVSLQDAKLSFLEGNITKNGISMPSAVPVSARLIQGDVNCDGEVGIVGDLRTVAIYYDKTPLDPDWSTISKYDLTEDSIIDIFDLVVVAANYPYP